MSKHRKVTKKEKKKKKISYLVKLLSLIFVAVLLAGILLPIVNYYGSNFKDNIEYRIEMNSYEQ